MAVKQKHIAKALGLSLITVSRALRGHPDLADETKKRVIQKAREMGYSNSRGRRSAARAVSPTRVGILFYQKQGSSLIGNPLESGVRRLIFHAIQKECQQREVETIIDCPTHDQVPMLVKNKTIQAAIFFGSYPRDITAKLQGIPALAISRYTSGLGHSGIVADNFNGMRQATQALIDQGHRDILMLARKDASTQLYENRVEGYYAAMRQAGLKPACWYSEDELPPLPMDQIGDYSALACSSDSLAYNLKYKLYEANYRVPEHFSLVGFDNLMSAFSSPISTYAPDWDKMGRLATKLLLDPSFDVTSETVTITVPGHMILRDTIAPFKG